MLLEYSLGSMKKMLTLSHGIKLLNKDLEEFNLDCEICQKTKQTRLNFGEPRTRAIRPLQIIHTDLCGPIDPITWDRKKYFLTFLDDYTHYTIVYLLENKSEVQDIKEYVHRVEAHWNTRVLKIRCDNGKEYMNKNVLTWCKQREIIIDNTTSHIPQLNGKAERNRIILDKIRALLFDSRFNKEMWGEALYSSIYILNRLPTLSSTPYEM